MGRAQKRAQAATAVAVRLVIPVQADLGKECVQAENAGSDRSGKQAIARRPERDNPALPDRPSNGSRPSDAFTCLLENIMKTNLTRRTLVKGGTALATSGGLTGPALLEWAKAWAQQAPWKPENRGPAFHAAMESLCAGG
jgi:hypothetical protein